MGCFSLHHFGHVGGLSVCLSICLCMSIPGARWCS